MRYLTLLSRYALGVLFFGVASVFAGEKLVLASSNASSEYLKNRAASGKRQSQNYVFMAGRHLPGNTRDSSLEKTSFRTIAERLARDLHTQDFLPATSLAEADLLLVVHWGVTAGRNRDAIALASSAEALANLSLETEVVQNNLAAATAAGDMEGAGQARDALSNLTNETKSEYQNIFREQDQFGEDSASLLGLNSDLAKEGKTLFDQERRKTLLEMTREECYFVIVMAYDARTLVSTKKLKRVWTSRLSMSSAGVNFYEALDRLSNVASRYFGTKQPEVTFDYPMDRKRQERVDFGEFVVIGTVNP